MEKLFFNFEAPTVFAHSKIIYWLFGPEGEIDEEAYRQAKKEKIAPKPMVTIKLSGSADIVAENPMRWRVCITSSPASRC